jgi:hypothetical protein
MVAGCASTGSPGDAAGPAIQTPSNGAPTSPAPTQAPADTGPKLDPAVLAGQAPTIDGASFDLGSVANKDLVIWFWAPW